MSIRAEALRFALRHLSKHRDEPPPDVFAIRRNLDRMSRLIPPPPRGIEIRTVDVAGMRSLQVTTPRTQPGRHLLYLHGGAYSYGSPTVYRDLLWRLADATQSCVLGLRYRLAPEHPFPAAVDDAVAGYRWLLAARAAPDCIAIAGDSAGGGLAFATLLRLRDERVPLPAAAAGLSPWTDLTFSGPSFRANAKADPMLNASHARFLAKLYLGVGDPSHPHASPLLGDHTGLPPSLIQVGGDEILHDDAARLADGMQRAGCVTELQVWPRMPHVWQVYAMFLPEAREAIAQIGGFILRHMR